MDIFLKFIHIYFPEIYTVYQDKWVENELVGQQNPLVTEERPSVKIATKIGNLHRQPHTAKKFTLQGEENRIGSTVYVVMKAHA